MIMTGLGFGSEYVAGSLIFGVFFGGIGFWVLTFQGRVSL